MTVQAPPIKAEASRDSAKASQSIDFLRLLEKARPKTEGSKTEKMVCFQQKKNKQEMKKQAGTQEEPLKPSDESNAADPYAHGLGDAAQAVNPLAVDQMANPEDLLIFLEDASLSLNQNTIIPSILASAGPDAADAAAAAETETYRMQSEQPAIVPLSDEMACLELDAAAEINGNPAGQRGVFPSVQTQSSPKPLDAGQISLADGASQDLGTEPIQKAYAAGQYQTWHSRRTASMNAAIGNTSRLENRFVFPEAAAGEKPPGEVQEDAETHADAFRLPEPLPEIQYAESKISENNGVDILDQADLLEKIQKGTRSAVMNGKNEFMIRLKPEGLGEITVKLSENRGKFSLSMVISSPETEKMVSRHLEALKEALRPYQTEIQSITSSLSSSDDRPAQGEASVSGQQSWNRQGSQEQNGFKNIKLMMPDPGTSAAAPDFFEEGTLTTGYSLLDQYV
jgi:hypothetical protein